MLTVRRNRTYRFVVASFQMLNSQDAELSSSIRPARDKLGQQPEKVRAKVYEDNSDIPDMDTFTDHEPSGTNLPQFAAQEPKQPVPQKSIKEELPPKFLDNVFQKERYTVFPQKGEWPPLYIFVRGLVWVCYVIGNSQTEPQLTMIAYIDFAGVALAMVLTAYKIFGREDSFQLCDGGHVMSLGVTIALFTYNPGPGNAFTKSMYLIRSLRVLFPLNFNHFFSHLVLKYGALIVRIFKVSLPWFLAIMTIALVMGQVLYYNIFNRCRLPYTFGDPAFPAPGHYPLLCGWRQCPTGYTCLNPYNYNQPANAEQYKQSGTLAYGYYLFSDFIHSFYTVIALGSLSNTTAIMSIYSQGISPTFFTLLSMTTLFITQFLGAAALLALMDEFFNSSQSDAPPPCRPDPRNSITNKISGDPTFGPLSVSQAKSKQQEPLSFRGQSLNSPSGLVATGEVSEMRLKRQLSISHQKSKVVAQGENQDTKSVKIECGTLCLVKLVVKILFCLVQAQMAITYAFKFNSEAQREAIGPILVALWAFWAVYVMFKAMNVLITDETAEIDCEQTKQDKQLVFSIERGLFAIFTADLTYRLAKGESALTGMSVITPLASSVLLFRVTYIPFMIPEACDGETFENLRQKIRTYFNLLKVYRVVITILTIYAVTLGSLSGVFSGDLWKHTPRWLGQLAGGGWQASPVGESWIDQPSVLVTFLRIIAVVIGQLCLFYLMFSDASLTGFFQTQKRKQLRSSIYDEKRLSEDQLQQMIRQQKSFGFIEFQGCRLWTYEFLQNQNYTKYKLRFIIFYLVGTFLAFTIFPGNIFVTRFLTLFDFFFIIDNIANAVARRVWGPGSLIDGKWYNIVNPLIGLFLQFNIKWFWVQEIGLRALRFFYLIELSKEMEQAYSVLRDATRRFITILPIFALNWVVMSVVMCGLLKEYSDKSPGLGPVFSFRIFQRGFDFGSVLSVSGDHNGQLLGYSGFLMFLAIAFPPQALLVGMILSMLKQRHEMARDRRVGANLGQSMTEGARLKMLQLYQNNEVQKKILHLEPHYNEQYGTQNNCLLDIITTYPNAFWWAKTTCILMETFFLVLSHFLRAWVSEAGLVEVKVMRIFFILLSISAFAVEALAYRGDCQYFYSKFIIYAFAFPGAFIGVVPLHLIQGSQQMMSVLEFFLTLTPLTTLQLFLVFERRAYQVAYYLYSKVRLTIYLTAFLVGFSFFAAGLMLNFTQLHLAATFSYVVVGMLGGPYQVDIEARMVSKGGVYAVQTLVFFLGMVTRNAIIASLLYEVLDYFRQIKKDKDHLCITIEQVGTLFNQLKFLKLWKELDPYASGMLSFKTVINHLPRLMACFDLKQAYLQIRLLSKRRARPEKLALFRRLHFPIRSGSSFEKGEAPQIEGYVITIHDVAVRLLCMALEEQFYRRQGQQPPVNADYQNWANHLGFNDQQWHEKVHKAINRLNALRLEVNEGEKKYNAPAKVETTSWAMGCVMGVLPRMRTKLQEARLRLQR